HVASTSVRSHLVGATRTRFWSLPASLLPSLSSFFFAATAPPEIYTLSLHDALPISITSSELAAAIDRHDSHAPHGSTVGPCLQLDRKSTRLNSSHRTISYAVFCLKKKKKGCKQSSRNMDTPELCTRTALFSSACPTT